MSLLCTSRTHDFQQPAHGETGLTLNCCINFGQESCLHLTTFKVLAYSCAIAGNTRGAKSRTCSCTTCKPSRITRQLCRNRGSRTFSAQSMSGSISLQGPHQVSQKSTSTALSDCNREAGTWAKLEVSPMIIVGERVPTLCGSATFA